jgi:hypothetical protein
VAPTDVTFTLKDWGSNYTGSLPVVEFIDGVHRTFPAVALGSTTPPPAQAPQSTASMKIGAAGSSLLVGMFATAGGAGDFEAQLQPTSGPGTGFSYSWRPPAAGSHFEWHEYKNPAVGDWNVAGSGSAQASAFLFLEAYEARTTQTTLANP